MLTTLTGTRQFGSAQEVPSSLELLAYAGGLPVGEARNSTYYDDDGLTTAYTKGAYALTTVQLMVSSNWASVSEVSILNISFNTDG